jgi:hypothetical protein
VSGTNSKHCWAKKSKPKLVYFWCFSLEAAFKKYIEQKALNQTFFDMIVIVIKKLPSQDCPPWNRFFSQIFFCQC